MQLDKDLLEANRPRPKYSAGALETFVLVVLPRILVSKLWFNDGDVS